MQDWPRKVSDWEGARCRSKQPLENGLATIPAGTDLTVSGVSGGRLSLSGDPCPCCGVSVRVVIKGTAAYKKSLLAFVSAGRSGN